MLRRPLWLLRNKRKLRSVAASAFAGLFGLCSASGLSAEDAVPKNPELALMGTIPIYWGEARGFDDLLDRQGESHWARSLIERQFALRPLDYLSAEALAGRERLLLAQPRGFSPEENVALDAWVRAGGRVLLFADPQMTGESHFALGDRRRPQDVALLSPILAHWGLELTYESAQPNSLQMRDFAGTAIPVRLAGRFQQASEARFCVVLAEGLLADCALGEGRALVLADAAMLDLVDPAEGAQEALAQLMEHIFGDHAGNAAGDPALTTQHIEKQDKNTVSDATIPAPEEGNFPP